jgi:hypothetical protein
MELVLEIQFLALVNRWIVSGKVRSPLTRLLVAIHVLLQLIKLSLQSESKELMSKWGNVVFGGSEICKFSAARTFCTENRSLNLERHNLNNERGKLALQVM